MKIDQPIGEFLLARIAEDEAVARRAGASVASQSGPSANVASGMFGISAQRALAECEAKRRIVESHRLETTFTSDSVFHSPVLRALAAIYADHPDYREEWRP